MCGNIIKRVLGSCWMCQILERQDLDYPPKYAKRQIWTSKLTHNSSRGDRNWTKNYKRNHPNIVILDSSNLLHLQEPKMRGQACWSMGKLFSIIGHLAFTVNLQKNFNSTTSHQIPDNTSSSKWYLHSLIFGEVY